VRVERSVERVSVAIDPGDVIVMPVRDDHRCHLDVQLLSTRDQRLNQPVAVDEDASAALAIRHKVGVRGPLRGLGALDDHASSSTVRMPSW
jgi:hypothetical protein